MRFFSKKKVTLIVAVAITVMSVCVGCGKENPSMEKEEPVGPTGTPEVVIPPEEDPITDYEYRIENNEAVITRYIGNKTKAVIPSEIDGIKVTSIGGDAFIGCGSVTDVIMPSGVVSIGYKAFNDTAWYQNFENDIVIANNILIGYKGSDSSVTIPDGVTAIGVGVFWDCKNLTNVTIPDSVTSIDQYAFAFCSNLTNVTIPDSVISIGDEAFAHCSDLSSVTISDGAISIGAGAFYGTAWSETDEYMNRMNMVGENNNVEKVYDSIYTSWDYIPFRGDDSILAKADFTPTLTIKNSYPMLDGATAFFPIYSAVAETVYKNLDYNSVQDFLSYSTTTGAYERLINGETDIIFVLEPSQAQLNAAKGKGVNMVLTKISKEAFVFFVNKENKVDNLTVGQIQDIYTKKITNWKELGWEDKKIIPFQREENSGSQTIMSQRVMQNKTLAAPLEETIFGMQGIIERVASYRNYSNSIGYSFRYYATVMNPNAQIKLLSINGVAPTEENIANGTYPFVYDIYAVTTEETAKKENVKLLIDWLLSEQGQRLIELCGYTPIKP